MTFAFVAAVDAFVCPHPPEVTLPAGERCFFHAGAKTNKPLSCSGWFSNRLPAHPLTQLEERKIEVTAAMPRHDDSNDGTTKDDRNGIGLRSSNAFTLDL